MKLIHGTAVLTCTPVFTATESIMKRVSPATSTPSPPPQPQPAPEMQDAGVVASRDNERRRRRSAASNTFLSGALSAAPAVTGTKTLLGS